MERVTEMKAEYLGPSAILVAEDAPWIMEQVEAFFIELGARILKRKPGSIKAKVSHPDGFTTTVSVQYYADVDGVDGNNIVEPLRRSGDALLYARFYQKFLAFDFGRGQRPEPFVDNELCPRPVMTATTPPLLVLPAFHLDAGEKRKLVDVAP